MVRGKKPCVDQFAVGDGIAVASATEGQSVDPPKVIQLFKMGAHPSRNGKPAIVRVDDLAHAERIAAATAAYHRTNDMVIDYDHQSVFGAKNGVGQKAPASGWSPRVFATEEGVFAEVGWTAAGAAAIVAKEYRYISPVFAHDKAGRPIFVVNATLTNTPSLDLDAVATAFASLDLDAVEAAFASSLLGEIEVNLSLIAKALGLGEDASEEEILRAIANMNSAPAAMTAIATALGVTEGADLVAAATALKEKADNAGNPDPSKFVPVATVADLTTSVQSLQGTVNALQLDKRKQKIDAAQAAGSLPPALVAHATAIADEAQLDAFLGALPTTGLGKSAVDPIALNADGKLTDDQIALCSSMGWDQAAYLEQLKKEAE